MTDAPLGQDKSIYWSKRWRDLRKQVFARDQYTCRMCGKLCHGEGRADPNAPECDHITPHRNDPALMWDPDNLQTLHKRCHSIKTSIEDGGMFSGAQTHPEWLPKPACPVVVVSGPPGAGKTTWAQAKAGPADVVIDLDDCFTLVCGVHGHHADKSHLKAALRIRNKMLANLASQRTGRAYFIVGAPTKAERQWWADKLSATVHLIRPEPNEIAARDLTQHRKDLAFQWYELERLNRWKKPAKTRTVGLDGYPV